MRSRSFRPLLAVAGIAVSALFTYLAVRHVDFGAFWAALKSIAWWWLAPALAALALGVFLRGLRWRLLFARETRPSVGAATSALLIGYLFNNILPARAGELARVVALHQRAGTSRVEALATAFTERLYDVLTLLALLFVSAPFLPEVTWLRRAALLAVILTALLLAVILVLAVYGERPARLALRPLARIPGVSLGRIDRAAANLVQGLAALRRPGLAAPAFLLTVVSWLVLALSFWIVTLAFDLELGFGAGLLALVATGLGAVLPASPASVGVFEAATQVALRAYGVDNSTALSYAVVLHAVNFFPYLAVGYLVLYRHAAAVRRMGRLAASG